MTINTATKDGIVHRKVESILHIKDRKCAMVRTDKFYTLFDYKSGMAIQKPEQSFTEAGAAIINAVDLMQSEHEHVIEKKIQSDLKFYGLEYPLNK